MNDTTLLAGLPLPKSGLVFDLEALYVCLQTVPDHRDHRGLQYPLASLLMIGVLAKLAGQDSSRAMAHWAKLRTHELSQLLHLKREKMPHFGSGLEPRLLPPISDRAYRGERTRMPGTAEDHREQHVG